MALAVEEPSEDRGGRDDGGDDEEEDDEEDEEAEATEEEATEEEDCDEGEVVEEAKGNEKRTGRVGMEEGLEMGLLGELD